MRPSDGLWAIAVGLVGFAAVELAGRAAGVLTAITRHAWLDASVFALTVLALAMVFAPTFRRARAWALPLWVLLFVATFAPVAAVLGAAAELTLDGRWGAAAIVRSAVGNVPGNRSYARAIDTWFVSVPLGVVGASLLAWRARAARPSRSAGRRT